ncbi:hypothetical protein [Streptomyces sp. NPDC006307]|uniref:hypothetical protein n=1 Tax=Streptomyces sp. NPDC006307 TaxID=3156748 RepID=UPI0033A99FB9
MSTDDINPDDEWPLPPAWMFDCADCVRIYGAMKRTLAEIDILSLTVEPGVDYDPFDSGPGSQIRLAHHLATSHRDLLPDWLGGCARCADHRRWLTKKDATGYELVAAEHRAAHLFIPPSRVGLF